jgi:hypothetical protein
MLFVINKGFIQPVGGHVKKKYNILCDNVLSMTVAEIREGIKETDQRRIGPVRPKERFSTAWTMFACDRAKKGNHMSCFCRQ